MGLNRLLTMSVLIGCLVATGADAQPLRPQVQAAPIEYEPVTPGGLAEKPIAIGNHPAIDKLRQWYTDGTAAGNVGDVYFNRDFRHSQPNLGGFPQVSQVKLDAKNRHQYWGLFTGVLPHVTIGNSSTARGVLDGGSNARLGYASRQLVTILGAQFINSNLFVYPEHRDFDPGINGWGGYGDVFATNTPYLLISRGSSGSDRIFVESMFRTLAALQPQTKKVLRDSRLLMSTLQMILRRSLTTVKTDQDYLSGIAHPVVFEGDQVDVVKMVEMAHGIDPSVTPPMAVITVTDESESQPGRDYFYLAQPEQFSTTPCAITRVLKGLRAEYTMRISAQQSIDLHKRKLQFKWALLSGDPNLVSITPTDPQDGAFTSADISVQFHNERWPSPSNPNILTSRVDVACFAYNGKYYSQPAIISFFMPPDQRVTRDDVGRVIEIGHGAYEVDLNQAADPKSVRDHAIRDWPKMMRAMQAGDQRGALWRTMVGDKDFAMHFDRVLQAYSQQERLRQLASAQYTEAYRQWDEARKAQPVDRAAVRLLDIARRQKQKQRDLAEADLQAVLVNHDAAMGQSPRRYIEKMLMGLIENPSLFINHGRAAIKLEPRIRKYVDQLVTLGVLVRDEDHYRISALRGGEAPLNERLTAYERSLLRYLNYEMLNELSGGLMRRLAPAYVDAHVKLARQWRDIYQYDSQGQLTGWVRVGDADRPQRFDAKGRLIVERNDQGAAIKVEPVTYSRTGASLRQSRLKTEIGRPVSVSE